MESYWRWHMTLRPPTIEPVVPGGRPEQLSFMRNTSKHRGCDCDYSAAPSPDWLQPDFDDSTWPRTRGRWLAEQAERKLSTMVLSLRGRFLAPEPQRVKNLYLFVAYHGGVRVFLNGQEVARQHVPVGNLTENTPAQSYDAAAFVSTSGEIIGTRNADPATLNLRVRKLGPIEVPTKFLRRGVNVLAIEIRRTHYHPSAKGWWNYPLETRKQPWWTTGKLVDVWLRAEGTGVRANVARPPGFQVWVQDRNDRVYTVDYGDPAEPLGKIRLIGVRNAGFCGQFVIGSSQEIRDLKLAVTPLRTASGTATIPSECIVLLCGHAPISTRGVGTWFRNLTPDFPSTVPVLGQDGAVLPVLVRVEVPKDAIPGTYQGSVTVSAAGVPKVQLPLELTVSAWTAPDPQHRRTYVGLYQSPQSVALQYKVEPWSDRHFKLMERSFDLLARAGNKMVNIPVVDETQFGEPEGMIRWIRRANGKFDYDFAIFDRYMKMVVDRCGPQDYVCLQVWHAGGWEMRPLDNKVTVQVVEEKTGQRSAMQVPTWGTEEAVAFWRPFFAAVQARLEALRMPNAMTIGILSDSTAPEEVFRTLGAAFPGGKARWHRGCHGHTNSTGPYKIDKDGLAFVTLHEHCYGMTMILPNEAEKALPPLHAQRGWPGTAYFRVSNHENRTSWIDARTLAENALWTGKQGVGRICLDFWPVLPSGPRMTDIYNRYPHSSCAQREPSLKSMTWPGPEGAETTFMFEAFVEGLAEAEAVIVVSEALHKRRGALGTDLATECERVLLDRLGYLWITTEQAWGHHHTHHYGWQELNRRLFECAARVSSRR
ncbi:MAG: glycoside hydrolase domain-containing protein [Kiritimatiellia bacterium]